MLIKYLFTLVFSSLSFFSYAQNHQNFDWLIGKWKAIRTKETNLEIWSKKNDSTYISRSFIVKNNDTALFETVELIKKNNFWNYTVTANNENDNKPISFKLEFIGNKEFISLNLKHDFPTRISYRLVNNNLYASIEGNINNALKKINFDYKKY
ncbi:MAG: DUF6265 family protein [Chitinophagaceae bacterium]